MLDAFIIEEIRRREQFDERRQPRLQRPGAYPTPYPPRSGPDSGRPELPSRRHYDEDEDDSNNGVIVLDM